MEIKKNACYDLGWYSHKIFMRMEDNDLSWEVITLRQRGNKVEIDTQKTPTLALGKKTLKLGRLWLENGTIWWRGCDSLQSISKITTYGRILQRPSCNTIKINTPQKLGSSRAQTCEQEKPRHRKTTKK